MVQKCAPAHSMKSCVVLKCALTRERHFAMTASPGQALFDATMAVIIGQCGRVIQRSLRRTNDFTSKVAMLKDDYGDHLCEYFDKAIQIYKDLIEFYTSPADWVVNRACNR